WRRVSTLDDNVRFSQSDFAVYYGRCCHAARSPHVLARRPEVSSHRQAGGTDLTRPEIFQPCLPKGEQGFLFPMNSSHPTLVASLRALPRPAWILFLGTFLNKFGTFVVPFLALYLTRRGYSMTDAGLAVGAYGVG